MKQTTLSWRKTPLTQIPDPKQLHAVASELVAQRNVAQAQVGEIDSDDNLESLAAKLQRLEKNRNAQDPQSIAYAVMDCGVKRLAYRLGSNETTAFNLGVAYAAALSRNIITPKEFIGAIRSVRADSSTFLGTMRETKGMRNKLFVRALVGAGYGAKGTEMAAIIRSKIVDRRAYDVDRTAVTEVFAAARRMPEEVFHCPSVG